MSELMEQHERWRDAHSRLLDGGAKPPEVAIAIMAPEPEPPKYRKSGIFLGPIIELDDDWNPVVEDLPGWRQIALQVAKKHDVTVLDMISARRLKTIVAARHEAFYRCRMETKLSLTQIGYRFGGRDHSTVIAGSKKHAKRMARAAE